MHDQAEALRMKMLKAQGESGQIHCDCQWKGRSGQVEFLNELRPFFTFKREEGHRC